MAHFLSFVGWDVLIVNEKEGVSACNPLGMGGITGSNALAQLSKFIGVRSIPGGFVAGVPLELAMLEEFACGGVKHQESLWTVCTHQYLTEVYKTINLFRLHSHEEPCKAD